MKNSENYLSYHDEHSNYLINRSSHEFLMQSIKNQTSIPNDMEVDGFLLDSKKNNIEKVSLKMNSLLSYDCIEYKNISELIELLKPDTDLNEIFGL